MYRTIQFQIAHEILRIMREENGKPWMDSPGNVNAIFRFIYGDGELPYFMKDCANQIKDLYQNRVTPEYIANLNKAKWHNPDSDDLSDLSPERFSED